MLAAVAISILPAGDALARSSKHRSGGSSHATSHSSSKHAGRSPSRSSGASTGGRSHGRHGHGSHIASGRSAGRHSRHHHVVAHHESKSRHAYPIGIFIKSPPSFDTSPLDEEKAREVVSAFNHGTADSYPARTLVRAGLVHYHPLHGGIYWRREPVKYIIMHSTETGIPISAVNVINGWSSMGMRHPGAQYVVDRDGTIYQAVDPELATVHVNIFKTLPGINNDNSIGIEMNHTGSQNYPIAQRDAVIKLVGYLKHRYNIDEGNIITHRYAQQGDHTDPVNFDWDEFLATVNTFHNQAIAYRTGQLKDEARKWKLEPEPKYNTYLKPHREIGATPSSDKKRPGEEMLTAPAEASEKDMDEALTAPVAAPSPAVAPTIAPAPAAAPTVSPPPTVAPTVAPAPAAVHVNTPDRLTMPESAVPEPSEADSPTGAATSSGGAAKTSPLQMKVYPQGAPLPGGAGPSR